MPAVTQCTLEVERRSGAWEITAVVLKLCCALRERERGWGEKERERERVREGERARGRRERQTDKRTDRQKD